MTTLTMEQKRDISALTAKRDADIDFSDLPPVLDWSGAEIGKFYWPNKKSVIMGLDSDAMVRPCGEAGNKPRCRVYALNG